MESTVSTQAKSFITYLYILLLPLWDRTLFFPHKYLLYIWVFWGGNLVLKGAVTPAKYGCPSTVHIFPCMARIDNNVCLTTVWVVTREQSQSLPNRWSVVIPYEPCKSLPCALNKSGHKAGHTSENWTWNEPCFHSSATRCKSFNVPLPFVWYTYMMIKVSVDDAWAWRGFLVRVWGSGRHGPGGSASYNGGNTGAPIHQGLLSYQGS